MRVLAASVRIQPSRTQGWIVRLLFSRSDGVPDFYMSLSFMIWDWRGVGGDRCFSEVLCRARETFVWRLSLELPEPRSYPFQLAFCESSRLSFYIAAMASSTPAAACGVAIMVPPSSDIPLTVHLSAACNCLPRLDLPGNGHTSAVGSITSSCLKGLGLPQRGR